MMGEALQDDNDGEEAQEEGQRRRAGYGVREARVQGKNGTERLSGTRKLSPFSEQGMEQRKCRHPWIAIGRASFIYNATVTFKPLLFPFFPFTAQVISAVVDAL
jgi:hypothetical protein